MCKSSFIQLLVYCVVVSICIKGYNAYVCSVSEVDNCKKGYNMHIVGAKNRICNDAENELKCVNAVKSECQQAEGAGIDISLVISKANDGIKDINDLKADWKCAGSTSTGGNSNGSESGRSRLWILAIGHFFPVILLASLF